MQWYELEAAVEKLVIIIQIRPSCWEPFFWETKKSQIRDFDQPQSFEENVDSDVFHSISPHIFFLYPRKAKNIWSIDRLNELILYEI